jgi:transketolase
MIMIRVSPEDYAGIGTREAYGRVLLEIGRRNKNVVLVGADCVGSVRGATFAGEFPERTINFGIAEQNMVAAAAGLALSGKIPVVSTFAMLMTLRACEFVRNDLGYANTNVKLVATAGGLSFCYGGSTHHALEDLAIVRTMPNLTIIVPADGFEVAKALVAAVEHVGPVYMRLGRGGEPDVYTEDYDFSIGKAVTMREGDDVALIATGNTVRLALQAADQLSGQGWQARVLNMHTVKPIDRGAVLKAAAETGRIVTIEEHTIVGGLGGAVAEVTSDECPVLVRRLGVPDVFCGTGSMDDMFCRIGIMPDQIAESAIELLRKQAR